METPDPIPNSVVKHCITDGTALATLWESRSLPDLKMEKDKLCLSFSVKLKCY